ncbi:MAG: radical SAM/SPASM domain-containing protein [Planctomycetota bacterium]|nr:radical SAM/SPASM domain-containing protein [Planctomycetota bacterium]
MYLLRMAKRVLFEADKRLMWKLAWRMGWKGMRSVQKHKQRMKKGEFFPPFLYVSVINSCNLRCQGCWVDVAAKQQTIDKAAMSKLINEAKDMGNVFFGIVGGEPFMHPELMDILEAHPECYFQVFTNGHFITDEKAKRLKKMGNVTPLISVEGTEIISDQRRGRDGVLSKTMEGVHNCLNNGLLTGVCTSVCQTNIDDLMTEAWIDRLIEMGVFYTWFHIYRPMGPEASPELCLTPEQQLRARKFVVDMRAEKPIVIVDAYFDGQGQALCPAANGISHHINPWGDIEPCPIIQFSKENIHDESKSLREKFVGSEFLQDFRKLAQETTRGCIVLERPDLLSQLVEKHSAKDATVRQTAMPELKAMSVRTSQYNPGNEVPERNWLYRFAKKHWFNDFGVYKGHDHSQTAAPGLVNRDVPETSTASAESNLVELSVVNRN